MVGEGLAVLFCWCVLDRDDVLLAFGHIQQGLRGRV